MGIPNTPPAVCKPLPQAGVLSPVRRKQSVFLRSQSREEGAPSPALSAESPPPGEFGTRRFSQAHQGPPTRQEPEHTHRSRWCRRPGAPPHRCRAGRGLQERRGSRAESDGTAGGCGGEGGQERDQTGLQGAAGEKGVRSGIRRDCRGLWGRRGSGAGWGVWTCALIQPRPVGALTPLQPGRPRAGVKTQPRPHGWGTDRIQAQAHPATCDGRAPQLRVGFPAWPHLARWCSSTRRASTRLLFKSLLSAHHQHKTHLCRPEATCPNQPGREPPLLWPLHPHPKNAGLTHSHIARSPGSHLPPRFYRGQGTAQRDQ